ncbi:cytidine deaminase [Carnobacteriaceae bacterium zg-ZUI78]|nr:MULTISPECIES: cytidine deaminase [unclassified Granulicatella]MBS4750073.1 cytidine deaminase [Carnobacteriaceae bacterium zg-ZUI78]QMI86633.1 cytidine deaminase [Carnobacteriaceae bacterium zg-84]
MTKEELMTYAQEALQHAYCPYSNFPVGAAILYKDGTVIKGANIENVSFGATSCAERSALFAGASQGYRKGDIVAIAVAGKTEDYLPPCNICRQALVEFCSPETPVYLVNGDNDILSLTLNDLVPYSFTKLDM